MRFKTKSPSSLFRKRKKGINWKFVPQLLWRKRHFTWYNNISLHNTLLSLYNRPYKHSDNFKKIIFGKLKKATSTHHWLGILRKSAKSGRIREFLRYLRIPQKCPTKEEPGVWSLCSPIFFNVDASSGNGALTFHHRPSGPGHSIQSGSRVLSAEAASWCWKIGPWREIVIFIVACRF